MRVVTTRTGVVLSESGGALEKMLPALQAGRGRAGGGRAPVRALDAPRRRGGAILFVPRHAHGRGPVNVTAPEPVTNRELSRALGRVLHRPAVAPVPAWR